MSKKSQPFLGYVLALILFIVLLFGIRFISSLYPVFQGYYDMEFYNGDIISAPAILKMLFLFYIYTVVFIVFYFLDSFHDQLQVGAFGFFVYLVFPIIQSFDNDYMIYNQSFIIKVITYFIGILVTIWFAITSSKKAVTKRHQNENSYIQGLFDYFDGNFIAALLAIAVAFLVDKIL